MPVLRSRSTVKKTVRKRLGLVATKDTVQIKGKSQLFIFVLDSSTVALLIYAFLISAETIALLINSILDFAPVAKIVFLSLPKTTAFTPKILDPPCNFLVFWWKQSLLLWRWECHRFFLAERFWGEGCAPMEWACTNRKKKLTFSTTNCWIEF